MNWPKIFGGVFPVFILLISFLKPELVCGATVIYFWSVFKFSAVVIKKSDSSERESDSREPDSSDSDSSEYGSSERESDSSDSEDQDFLVKTEIKNIIPIRATPDSAGLDLFSPDKYDLRAGQVIWISTKISFAIPKGHVGLLMSRSSLAKDGILLVNGAGVIDADFRGELKIGLWNTNKNISSYAISPNSRIAQLVIVKYAKVNVKSVANLDETERGAGGFGSTNRFRHQNTSESED